MNAFQAWMKAATTAEQEQLAKEVGTSRAYLYHLSASEESDHRREPKPTLAMRIERVTEAMNKATKGRLPRVYRTDLVTACAQCDFAKRCLANTAAEFPVAVVKGE